MRYDRGDLASTLRAARHSAAAWDQTMYVYTTYAGFTIEKRPPFAGQPRYVVEPDGSTTFVPAVLHLLQEA